MPARHPEPDLRERLLAMCAYAGPGFLVPAIAGPHTAFLRWHTAQGFVLFFIEAIALGLVVILDATLGKVPLLGLLVMLVARIGLLAAFLLAAVLGAVKALAAEHFELPWVGAYARRLPSMHGTFGPPW